MDQQVAGRGSSARNHGGVGGSSKYWKIGVGRRGQAGV